MWAVCFLDIERDTHELLVYFEDRMYVKIAHPKFSYSKCIVFSFTFRSLNHFEFIYLFISLYAVRECSDFILLHVAVQFFSAPLTEETVFSPLYIIAFFVVG